MIIQKKIFLWIVLCVAFQFIEAIDFKEQFRQAGYVEIFQAIDAAVTFDDLYACFDELIEFFQANSAWAQKLYCAKERFIRCFDKNYYATDFFGLYDESQKQGRHQISFYYSIHFHTFICDYYPGLNQVPEIARFLHACFQIQKQYENLCAQIAVELGIENIFSSSYGQIPILFKVIKYFPGHRALKPHYDGSAFSLFLDSTHHESLFLAPYKSLLEVDDFISPVRQFVQGYNKSSILLIPGTLLQEFLIDPTPHIVLPSGNIRYAAIAFAMRPNYVSKRNEFSALPNFKDFS